MKQSAGALTKAHADMESRAGRGGRPSLESRLAANYRDANNKTLYSEGYDDRHHQLHPARFAPGVLCKIPDVWKLAKEFVPARGPDPVAQYDTKSVGAYPQHGAQSLLLWWCGIQSAGVAWTSH